MQIDEKYNGVTIDKNPYYRADPSGIRTGNGVSAEMIEMIERVCVDTESVLDKTNVTRKIATTRAMLEEKLENMRGVVIMAYPMGLPDYDNVRVAIEENCMYNLNGTPNGKQAPISITGVGLDGTAASVEIVDEATAELWIASRCLDRREKFCDRYGRNEKTKVIGKLQKLGAGAPGREAAVSEEERKAMMAFYFKKQEEQKALAENNEDDYLNSVWANPKMLQSSLRGQSTNVKAPGIR
jgi:cilia- and flagella-associated protein 298